MNWNLNLRRVKRLIMRSLTVVVCLFLVSCGSTQFVALQAKFPNIPEEMEKPCEGPVPLSGLSARAVETDWKKDRQALIRCGELHDSMVAWVRSRDADIKNMIGETQ